MRKKLEGKALEVLGIVSVSVAKRTVVSTTRYYNYQPEEDRIVYEKMKKMKIVKN